MMRITQQQDSETMTLKIEGCLSGAWVNEMKRCWDDITKSIRSSVVRIDLTEVTYIDGAGKELLAAMFASGVKPGAANVMTRAVIEQLTCAAQISPHRQQKRLIER